LTVIFAGLIGLGVAENCQYVLFFSAGDIGLPLATDHCHADAAGALVSSFAVTCLSESEVQLTIYPDSYTCEGMANSTILTEADALFDCSSSKQCGYLFGLEGPCGCVPENGDCAIASEYWMVADTCDLVEVQGQLLYERWLFDCPEYGPNFYSDDQCTNYVGKFSFETGCISNPAYLPYYGAEDINWLGCTEEGTTTTSSGTTKDTDSSAYTYTNTKTLLVGVLIALAVVA